MKKQVPFVRGFRVPNEQQINEALGHDAVFTEDFCSSFDCLPVPTDENDWLAKYKETGQTYSEFIDDCPFLDDESSSRTTIYLTLFDNNDHLALLDVDRLIDYTQRFFQMPVKLISVFSGLVWNETKSSWTCMISNAKNHREAKQIRLKTRYDRSTGHSQVYVGDILKILKSSVPTDARCLVAITAHDFYSDQSDLFIAGLSHGNARVAAFSFFRYDPRLQFSEELWYDWKVNKTQSSAMKSIVLLRSCRLLTHEIGHLLGIAHCIYYACLMNGSGHLQEDFSQPLFLCPIDLRKIFRLSHFDVCQRYEQLLEFCTQNKFKNEISVLKKRMEIMKRISMKLPLAKKRKRGTNDKPKANRKRSRQ